MDQPHLLVMAKTAERAPPESTPAADPSTAQILQFEIAERRARFEAYAAASSQVALYEFSIPEGATAAALGAPQTQRDARDQLQLVVALTGGAIAKFPGGLLARIPSTAADRFEALARPLIEAFLIGFQRAADQVSP
ncbi:hypothetical protein [Caulobacter segnis]|uniref:hypothetical protein n=1 Tax=Caulobacter segnis TaxID=88688 RepID=UPI00285C26AE|nr:hypothetical protein [Caulobacter segnis]MDR6624513.1 hypothetical protein [Caulobacter segnis]